jgi:hypothetical protein
MIAGAQSFDERPEVMAESHRSGRAAHAQRAEQQDSGSGHESHDTYWSTLPSPGLERM